MSSGLFAQPADNEIRTLTDTVAAQKQFISELQVQLERHNAVLGEISRRLDAITNANPKETIASPPAIPQESTPSRFDFYGESVLRLDNLAQSYADCSSCPIRTRGRFR